MNTDPLGGALQRSLWEHASEPAVRFGGWALSYGELAREVDAIRAASVNWRVGSVCLLGATSPTAVATLLACVRDGTPVLVPPPDLPLDLLRHAICVTGATTVVSSDGPARLVPFGEPFRCGPLDVVDLDAVPPVPCAGDRLLFTTSGTTGAPKVVPISGPAVHRFAGWARSQFGLGPGRKVLGYAPLHFDLSLLEVWAPLLSGAEVVLVEPGARADADQLGRLVASSRVEVVEGVPFLHRLLIGSGRRFPHVEWAITTGEALGGSIAAQLPHTFPSAWFANVYGCTETNDSFLAELAAADLDRGAVSIGRPLPGVEILIDGMPEQEGVGCEGMLSVSTPFQADRVIGAATDDDRFSARDGRLFYRTGDYVRRNPDGTFRLVGRADLVVKVRGTRVSIEGVEAVLASHPQVVECGVCARTDGAGEQQLVAHVRVAANGVSGTDLRSWCSHRLPSVAVPRHFSLWSEELPRGATGKVDRSALAAAGSVRPIPRREVEATDLRGQVEAHLIGVYLDGEAVGSLPGDLDLFATGVLDSLSVLALASWLEEAFALVLDDDELGQLVTLDGIVAVVERTCSFGPIPSDGRSRRSTDLEEFLS